MATWILVRSLILILGWPILLIGGLYALASSRHFQKNVREPSIGRMVLILNIGILSTMYCLGLISTFALFSDPVAAGPVVLPIFLVWTITMSWVLAQSSKLAKKVVEINRRIRENQEELEQEVDVRTKQIELELAKNEALIQSLGEGLIAADLGMKIVRVNPAAEGMLGWRAEEILGKAISADPKIVNEQGEEIDIKQMPAYQALLSKKRVETSVISKKALYYSRKDGSRFPVAITATPIILRKHAVGVIVLFRDISAEQEMDRAKSEFISLASHQLKTPPVAIQWNIEALLSDPKEKLTKHQRELLKDLHTIGERMTETVSSLLNVSRIELGSFIVDPKPVDFSEITQEILKELRPAITTKRLSVSTRFEPDLLPIPADPGLAKIIMENLLTNAVKYTPKSGQVSVEIVSLPNHSGIRMRVSDTGMGIPKADQSHIFEKMYRAENVRGSVEGTGFGLYLVKSIVELANGRVWFESKEGKGTTFFVELPKEGMRKKEGTSRLS